MRSKQGSSSALRKLALAAALAAVSAQAGALLVADGKYDSNEGYTASASFGILDDHGTTHTGKLYFGQDANGQYLYIQMPLGFVDNTYGTNAAADWFPPLSPANGHTFANLLNGDNLAISWAGGNTLTMDYLACTTNASANNLCSAGYASGGGGSAASLGAAGAGGATGANSKNDGAFSGSQGSKVLEVATSLEWNLNHGFSGNTADSPNLTSNQNPTWIKEVGYEVKFQTGTFTSDWLNATKAPGLITMSDPTGIYPSKKAFDKYTPPTCMTGCTNVPEPSTNVLLGIGALSLFWYARRRRDSGAPVVVSRLISS